MTFIKHNLLFLNVVDDKVLIKVKMTFYYFISLFKS